MEVLWRTTRINGLPGAYNLGMLYTNGEHKDLYEGGNGGAGFLDPDGYKIHDNTFYIYAGINQQLTTVGNDVNRGLSVSNTFALGDQKTENDVLQIHQQQRNSLSWFVRIQTG